MEDMMENVVGVAAALLGSELHRARAGGRSLDVPVALGAARRVGREWGDDRKFFAVTVESALCPPLKLDVKRPEIRPAKRANSSKQSTRKERSDKRRGVRDRSFLAMAAHVILLHRR